MSYLIFFAVFFGSGVCLSVCMCMFLCVCSLLFYILPHILLAHGAPAVNQQATAAAADGRPYVLDQVSLNVCERVKILNVLDK